jgi:hypothetical protein
MLKRINAALYAGNRGEQAELFVIAQGNGGAETATFEYNNAVLPPHPVQGHPGCSFTLDPGVHQFECIVVFNPGSPAARYDLFQVSSAGGSAAVNKNITAADPTPIIGFGIDGVTVAARARAAGPSRGMARGASAPSGPKTAPAAKKAKAIKVRKPAAKTRKKPARRKASAKKRARTTGTRSGTTRQAAARARKRR